MPALPPPPYPEHGAERRRANVQYGERPAAGRASARPEGREGRRSGGAGDASVPTAHGCHGPPPGATASAGRPGRAGRAAVGPAGATFQATTAAGQCASEDRVWAEMACLLAVGYLGCHTFNWIYSSR